MAGSAPEACEGGCHCGAVRYRVTVRERNGDGGKWEDSVVALRDDQHDAQ